jgi:hypothetical protein
MAKVAKSELDRFARHLINTYSLIEPKYLNLDVFVPNVIVELEALLDTVRDDQVDRDSALENVAEAVLAMSYGFHEVLDSDKGGHGSTNIVYEHIEDAALKWFKVSARRSGFKVE